jgi:ssDNA-binding Zn-finger/Zn-ribbon topoisomerase 1
MNPLAERLAEALSGWFRFNEETSWNADDETGCARASLAAEAELALAEYEKAKAEEKKTCDCEDCDGTGNFYWHDEDGDFLRCDTCKGSGEQSKKGSKDA